MLPLFRRLIRPGLSAALLLIACAAPARSAGLPWRARVWQIEDIPDANIRGVVQTPDGFLWVATLDYLARFDGLQFEKYQLSDFDRITQKIRCLLASRDGSLWLALEDGPVVRLHAGRLQVFANRQPDSAPQTFVEDGEGAIWVSYNRGPVCRIKDGRVTQITEGLPEGAGAILATDRQGRVWLAKRGEIGVFRHGRFEILLHLENMTTRMTAAADGGMWIFSGVHLLKYKEGGSPANCGSIQAMNPQIRAMVLLEDATDGSVWIGTQTGGLLHYTGAGFEAVPASHRTINSLLQDREGNIWAATGAGLTRINRRAITIEGGNAGLPSEAVQSLCEDVDGVLWAGTKDAALVRWQGNGWQPVVLPTDPAFEPVSRVAADPTGGIWVGTKRYKLHRFRNGSWTTWDQAGGVACHTITALLVSRGGVAWVAGEQPTMLAYVSAGKIHPLPVPPAAGRILSITEDPAGSIWAAGENGMLLKVDGGNLVDESLKMANAPSIRCLLATADGALWLGSDGGGLGRLKDGHPAFITTAQGLAGNHVSQIVADDGGWLWFGGDAGMFKARQEELEAAAEGRLARVHCVRYGGQEGLAGLHPTPDDWASAIRSRDGRLWMPLGQALAIIEPGKLHDDFTPPPVMITRIQMDDRTIAQYQGILPAGGVDLENPRAALRLPPGHRRLEFGFTALDFSAPESIRFLFQLEGFDTRWIDAGTQRSAGYSRLPPGRYRFHVRARSSNGEWNEAGASVAFVVTPFLWQRWWFQLVSLVGFTFVVAVVVRYVSHHRLRLKLRTLQQQTMVEQERSRIARDLHDDLGSRLTSMVLLNELAVQGRVVPERAVEHAREISAAARGIIQSLDETVWAVNPRNDALPHLINYIGQFAVDFLKIANVRCRLDLPDHPPARTVSAEVRHNLFLIVKEALNNAVKHGQPAEVRLRVAVTETLLTLVIEDDGRGFSRPPDDPSADGLDNMRSRMEAIGGQFQVDSTPAAGTRVILVFPWLQRP